MAATLELTFLGTSSPIHTGHRFGPSQVVSGGGANILVDCGWGATLRMYQSGIPPQRITALFITHLHSDHTTDIADFLVMRWLGSIERPLPVYGPEGTARMVAGFREALAADTRFRLAHHGEKLSPLATDCDVTELEAGDTPVVAAEIGGLTVKVFAVDHRPVMPAFGFRVERARRSVVISGDTVPCPGLSAGVAGADIFVSDSMNRPMMQRLEENLERSGYPLQAAMFQDAHTYHASTEEAAQVAREGGARHLVLSHVMPSIVPEQEAEFTAGLDGIFGGKISVAHDLERFVVSE